MQSRDQTSVRGVVTLARIERGKSQLGLVTNVAIPQRQPDYILAKINHQRNDYIQKSTSYIYQFKSPMGKINRKNIFQ